MIIFIIPTNDYIHYTNDLSLIILRLRYFVVNMYVLFEIVFAVFDYYCFEGHMED
jgi:hypothetical protein